MSTMSRSDWRGNDGSGADRATAVHGSRRRSGAWPGAAAEGAGSRTRSRSPSMPVTAAGCPSSTAPEELGRRHPVWRAENDQLIAEGTPQKPLPNPQTHLIWRGGTVKNFELKLEVRLDGPGTNSGIQYRSFEPAPGRGLPPPGQAPPAGRGGPNAPPLRPQSRWLLGGYQFDLDFVGRYTGQLYEGFTGRGIIAWRGDVDRAEHGAKPRLLGSLGDSDALKGFMKIGDWNQVHLIARGNTLIHILNGHMMAVLVDDDEAMRASEGLLGVQLEGTPDAARVVFRNIYIKAY